MFLAVNKGLIGVTPPFYYDSIWLSWHDLKKLYFEANHTPSGNKMVTSMQVEKPACSAYLQIIKDLV